MTTNNVTNKLCLEDTLFNIIMKMSEGNEVQLL